MITDLLQLRDLAPPMGDAAANGALSEPRAVWTAPIEGEPADPARRIIHSRIVRLHGPARLHRLGLRNAPGYHKCGSRQDPDWVTAVRVLVHVDGGWREILNLRNLPRPADAALDWHDLGGATAHGILIELRSTGVDEGWVPWALAQGACVLEGELLAPLAPRRERAIRFVHEATPAVAGVDVRVADGAVTFTTARYRAGFWLSRPGGSFLSLADEDPRLIDTNLLWTQPGAFRQGPQLHEIGRGPAIDPAVRFAAEGTATLRGDTITYDFTAGDQHYTLAWTAGADGLRLRARRESARAATAWISSAWQLTTRNRVSPAHSFGRITQAGEAGLMTLPVLVNFPAFGSLRLESASADVLLRADAWRDRDYNTFELKLGEQPLADGTYHLPAGRFEAEVAFVSAAPPARLRPDAPAVASAALRRTFHTALTYRPEMGTLSNNGSSTPCAISMDTWASYIFAHGEVLPGFPAHELLRTSLERWLDGGQSYADGRLLQAGRIHHAQDEYLMTGTAALRGLADYLERGATDGWFRDRLMRIRTRLAAMQARDLDGDGLIESHWRTGVSGTGQWSTCWFDVVSFGWKDAFANAILYPALRRLAAVFTRHGLERDARALEAWADRLQAAFLPTFLNPATGWLGGWRSKDGMLHDHAFLMVNGCAIVAGLVPADRAREICARLLREAESVGMPDAVYGLPANLHGVPDADLADIMQGFAFGYYQNGGRTHAQARHFLMALYQCGFAAEADRLLDRLCLGFAEARVFGGSRTGVDWRQWDDRPCGYEGLLSDQFGLLEVIYHRYGA